MLADRADGRHRAVHPERGPADAAHSRPAQTPAAAKGLVVGSEPAAVDEQTGVRAAVRRENGAHGALLATGPALRHPEVQRFARRGENRQSRQRVRSRRRPVGWLRCRLRCRAVSAGLLQGTGADHRDHH